MMNNLTAVSRLFYRPDIGLLFIRIALGVIFIHHGWMKLGNVPGAMNFMTMIGLPSVAAYAIITVEILGGLMLVLGVLTRVAGVATGIAMVVAFFVAVVPMRGYFGGEFEALLAIASFGIALTGAGKYRLLSIFEHDRALPAQPMSQGSSL